MKKRLIVMLAAVILLGCSMIGTASAASTGGVSFWLYDGSGCCAKLYYAPGNGQAPIFTGLYQDTNGDIFYYSLQ